MPWWWGWRPERRVTHDSGRCAASDTYARSKPGPSVGQAGEVRGYLRVEPVGAERVGGEDEDVRSRTGRLREGVARTAKADARSPATTAAVPAAPASAASTRQQTSRGRCSARRAAKATSATAKRSGPRGTRAARRRRSLITPRPSRGHRSRRPGGAGGFRLVRRRRPRRRWGRGGHRIRLDERTCAATATTTHRTTTGRDPRAPRRGVFARGRSRRTTRIPATADPSRSGRRGGS